MTWTNRVAWREGMFLRAQHFQQQDRWLEMLVRARSAALRPHPWGMLEMTVDRNLLATGRFALTGAVGVFEDGTPFAIPGEADHPPPLVLPEDARNVLVYLAIPRSQPGASEIVGDEGAEGRYQLRDFDAADTHSSSPQSAPLQIGRLRLRYLLETDDCSGYFCIGVARVVDVASDRRATLDDGWISPALACSAAAPLVGFLTEFTAGLDQQGVALAGRLRVPGGPDGPGNVADLLRLQAINRWQRLLAHWADTAAVHPDDLYGVFVQMAGELATFAEPSRRPKAYPAYRHDDLQRSFAAVVADLRRALVPEPSAISIALQERRYGVRVGQIVDRSVLGAVGFVLVARAGVPNETMLRLFRNQVKVGAVEQIRDVVNGAIAGIALRALPAAPEHVPSSVDAHYFELDRNSPHWQQMQTSTGFAIHVAGEFPNLELELWAIRG